MFLGAGAVAYRKYAWTHEQYLESRALLEYRYYKFRGLMNISYIDTYEKIKSLFPYEVKNIRNGIIYFGNNKYGLILSIKPRKMSPEELTECLPVLEQLIDSLQRK